MRFHALSGLVSPLLLAAGCFSATAASIECVDGGRMRPFEIERTESAWRDGNGKIALNSTVPGVSPPQAGGGFPVLYAKGRSRDEFSRRVATDRAVVRLEAGADIGQVARIANCGVARRSATPEGPHVLVLPDAPADVLEGVSRLARTPGVLSARPLLARRMARRSIVNDPFFDNQWHLQNVGANGGIPGIDIHIAPVWQKRKGHNIRVGIVDDGVLLTHPDLAGNIESLIDRNWNDGSITDGSASPLGRDKHGTACAGIVGAQSDNGIGLAGVAPKSRLVSLRLIAELFTEQEEAEAFGWRNDVIHVKSNSWGPSWIFEAPDDLAAQSLEEAITNGRSGLGTLFVWAAGNSAESGDSANYDGYANSPYTIAVGAVTDQGLPTEYSEPGACLVVSAPSSNSARQGIATTDLRAKQGYNPNRYYPSGFPELSNLDYTNTFGGTSAACPMVAGVVALVLEANPALGWRDVQEILIRSARKIRENDEDWAANGAGIPFHWHYGAGLVDADAAVRLATRWKNLPPRVSTSRPLPGLPRAIPDPGAFELFADFSAATGFRVEHVLVEVDLSHSEMADLEITLISPSGMESLLADGADEPMTSLQWTFSSVRHWGESAAGTWKLRVKDKVSSDSGTLASASITLYGAAFDSGAGEAPDNDAFASARPLAPGGIPDSGTNQDAGRETGEPDHGGFVDPDGRTIWWNWQAPESGTARVETAGSKIDTVLAVYTGTDLADLVQVGSNDDVEPTSDLTSRVTFQCTAGAVYRIAVSGYAGGFGPIALSARVLGPKIDLGGDLAFGPVATSLSATRTLTLTNSGEGLLSVTAVQLPAQFAIDWDGPFQLAGGESRFFGVTFAPEAAGSVAGDLVFTSNAVEGNPSTAISGQGFLLPDLFKGSYIGLAESMGGNPERALAKVVLSKQSAFSCSFFVHGKTWRLKGVLDATGSFSGQISRGRESPVNVELHLSPLGGFEGWLDWGGERLEFTAGHAPFSSKNPVTEQGNYTSALDPDPLEPRAPAGSGWATVKVFANGSARIVGILADGTRFTSGGLLDAARQMALVVPLRKATGSLSGLLLFRDLPAASDFDAPLLWLRAADPASPLYPSGFSATVSTVGSRYTKRSPADSLQVPPGDPTGTWTADAGGLASAIGKPVDFSEGNLKAFPADRNDFSIGANSGTGVVTGKFRHPSDLKATKFSGVLLQKSGEARGHFTHASGDGSVRLSH